jgi:hypothetical protein
MKKLIFQINVPHYSKNNPDKMQYSYDEDMYTVSNRHAQQYAHQCGADYYLLTDPCDYKAAAGKHLDYQKCKIYDFHEYDAIIYMDSDYIIKPIAPDLFNLCENKFSAVLDQGKSVHEKAEELGIPTNRYFNAGMMHIPKWVIEKTKDQVVNYLEFEYSLQGQGLLNKLFYDNAIEINELNFMDWNTVKRTFGKYADHYSGTKKDRWGTVQY